jgi:post-segregation antitoxin (ccd killing protein)
VETLGKKVRTTLTIDEEILKTAMQIGINISQFTENALKEAIEKLKSPENVSNKQSASFSLTQSSLFHKEKSVVARKRFELLSRAPEAPMLGHYTTGLQNGTCHKTGSSK